MLRKLLAILPFLAIIIFAGILYFSGAYHFISFQTIQDEHLKWKAFVDLHPVLSAFYYMGIYTISVLFIIPDSTLLTLLGGFLFPLPLATIYACFAETFGALLFYLAIRLAFKEALSKKKRHHWNEIEAKLQADEACYLLFLRFSHLLPFWIVNLVSGIFEVRVWTFLWTTFIGVVPMTFFLADAGANLSKYLETHTHLVLKDIFTPQLKAILIASACISLLPIVYKKLKDRFKRHH